LNKEIRARAEKTEDLEEKKLELSNLYPVEMFVNINIIDYVNFFEQEEPNFWIDYNDKCVTFVAK